MGLCISTTCNEHNIPKLLVLLIWAPAAEVHDGPQPLLGLLRSPPLRHSHRGGRKLLGALRGAPTDVGLGSPVDGPEGIVPAAEPGLILERLHGAHAHGHHPRRLRRTSHCFSCASCSCCTAGEWRLTCDPCV
uniref:Uncharacterized protein n=1 Tax=Triticum urartu TaxID=4572 RepID=A0A8R7TNZ1_TRIUA